MQGFDRFGFRVDHAGIGNQARLGALAWRGRWIVMTSVVKKFLGKVWEWKTEYPTLSQGTARQDGALCEYSHDTLDEGLSKKSRSQGLCGPYTKKGWIYRGEFIILWTKLLLALSDIEIHPWDRRCLLSPELHARIWLAPWSGDNSSWTMFEDVAVAVNPEDPRYKDDW